MHRKTTAEVTRALRSASDNPALPALIQSLPARDLARLCVRIGVRDALEIMALAPVPRLVQALEASVWKTPRPGVSEVFDARELVDWIGAWLDIGNGFAAASLAAIADEHLMLYLSQLATITTRAMWGFERSTEIGVLERIYAPSHDETLYGAYAVRARRQEDWETLRAALDAMWSDAPERLLHLFGQLSGDESMLAPQRNRQSSNDDVVGTRGSARERRGYVTASGARAFLALASRPLEELAEMCEYDLETRRHLSGLASDLLEDPDGGAPRDGDHARAPGTPGMHDPDVGRLAALHTALQEAGLLDPPPGRLLLAHEAASKQLAVVKLLRALAAKAPAELDVRGQELAYLSSVLIAGIAVDGAPLSPSEARAAALATCNLGLEKLRSTGERVRIDREPGLVRLFLIGVNLLQILPRRVERTFVQCLETLKKADSEPLLEWLVEQAQMSVADLSDAVAKGDLEAARQATMALCFVFDPRACTAVLPLLDELPRLGRGAGGAITWIDSMAAMAGVAELLRGVDARR
ncbi:MAG: DUF6178 family protein [Steroidobacteraceae bacterium]